MKKFNEKLNGQKGGGLGGFIYIKEEKMKERIDETKGTVEKDYTQRVELHGDLPVSIKRPPNKRPPKPPIWLVATVARTVLLFFLY